MRQDNWKLERGMKEIKNKKKESQKTWESVNLFDEESGIKWHLNSTEQKTF